MKEQTGKGRLLEQAEFWRWRSGRYFDHVDKSRVAGDLQKFDNHAYWFGVWAKRLEARWSKREPNWPASWPPWTKGNSASTTW